MQLSRARATPLGVVYTPPAVALPMVRVALAPLLAGRSVQQIAALRICDPAIGEGAFLEAVVDVLADALRAAGLSSDAAAQQAKACIAGVDIDPRAVEAARARLGVGEDQLCVADALALDWAAAFPPFDAVVGNPPYVRQEHLAAQKPALRAFASYDGVADLYVYFVELAHRIARAGGRYCLVTPNKWLTAAYARPLRTFLAEAGSVEGIVDFGSAPLFADADAFACIAWGTVGGATSETIAAARPAATAAVAHLAQLGPARHPDHAGREPLGVPHDRVRWRAEPWHIDSASDRSLIDRLHARFPSLGDVVPGRPARGVVTGLNRAFVLDASTRAALLAREPAAEALVRPFAKGRDLAPWRARQSERWILLVERGTSIDHLPAVRDHLAQFRAELERRKPGTYRWYELQDPVSALARGGAPRLLYQDIQTGPACCLDDGALVPDTTVWMLPAADRFLLALLNSPLYRWYAQRRFAPALNGAVRPKWAYLRALPVAQPSADLRAHVEALVGERLTTSDRSIDARIFDALADAYELSAADRALVAS